MPASEFVGASESMSLEFPEEVHVVYMQTLVCVFGRGGRLEWVRYTGVCSMTTRHRSHVTFRFPLELIRGS